MKPNNINSANPRQRATHEFPTQWNSSTEQSDRVRHVLEKFLARALRDDLLQGLLLQQTHSVYHHPTLVAQVRDVELVQKTKLM